MVLERVTYTRVEMIYITHTLLVGQKQCGRTQLLQSPNPPRHTSSLSSTYLDVVRTIIHGIPSSCKVGLYAIASVYSNCDLKLQASLLKLLARMSKFAWDLSLHVCHLRYTYIQPS